MTPTSTPVQIPSGSTMHFELPGAVSGVTTVQTSLRGDPAINFAPMTSAQNTVGNFVWSPNTLGTSLLTDIDFMNESGLPGFPPSLLSQSRTN